MRYEVILTFQFPAWDEKYGIRYYGIEAKSKSEAIRHARTLARREGHVPCTGKGRATFRADEEG